MKLMEKIVKNIIENSLKTIYFIIYYFNTFIEYIKEKVNLTLQ